MSQSPDGQTVLRAYSVVLHAKPATRIDQEIQLGFPDEEHRIQPVTIKGLNAEAGPGSSVPVGLEFRVQVYANDIDDALQKAGPLADSVASFITLVTGVGTPIVKPALAYEITSGKMERDFIQFFDDIPTATIARKVLAKKDLTSVLAKFIQQSDAEVADRVARAIRWYRLGTGTTDIFDRFNAYWIGLEALNKPLQDKLGVGDDKATCPKCQTSFVSTPTVSGIREFVNRYFPDEPKLYRRMHGLRINIMHSKTKLSTLLSECVEVTPKAGNALLGAIHFFLGFEKPWKLHSETITSANPFRLALPAVLISEKIEDAIPDGGGDPHFDGSHVFVGWKDRPDGKTDVTVTSTLTANIGKAKGRVSSIRVYGEGREGKLTVDKHEVHKAGETNAS